MPRRGEVHGVDPPVDKPGCETQVHRQEPTFPIVLQSAPGTRPVTRLVAATPRTSWRGVRTSVTGLLLTAEQRGATLIVAAKDWLMR
jgi:hypothetical protein